MCTFALEIGLISNFVKISVFGPSHLPLIVAGSMPNFPLASLAEWDSYGMELRQSHLISESNGESYGIIFDANFVHYTPYIFIQIIQQSLQATSVRYPT